MRCPLFIPLLVITACPAFAEDELVWLTSDFTTGGLVLQQAEECETSELSVEVAGDAAVRSQDGYIFVLNRFGYDNVTVLSASDPEDVLAQFSTGNGSNPQDILIIEGHKAYVAALQRTHLLIVDFAAGEITGQIDLSSFADTADGIPEAVHLIPAGDHVLVMCQRLDQTTAYWDPAGPGCLAMIDPETDAVVDANPATPDVDPIWLPCPNPTSWARTSAALLVACVGNWGLYDDGGLVGVDPTGLTPAAVAITETEAGGNLYEAAATGNSVHVVVSYPDWSYGVLPFDPGAGVLGDRLSGTSGGYVPDMVAHEGILYVADQGTSSSPELAGILLVDAAADTLICGPVQTGLPPASGAVVKPLDSPVSPLPEHAFTLVRCWPNPARHSVSLAHLGDDPGSLRITLYDLCGRELVQLDMEESRALLPLSDAAGRAYPAGSYILRARAEGMVEDHALIIR